MVMVMLRPAATALDLTKDEMQAIHDLLRSHGALDADEVASYLRLDENHVAIYLANETGLGTFDYRCGRYSAWHWL